MNIQDVQMKCSRCGWLGSVGRCEPDVDGDGNLGCPACKTVVTQLGGPSFTVPGQGPTLRETVSFEAFTAWFARVRRDEIRWSKKGSHWEWMRDHDKKKGRK